MTTATTPSTSIDRSGDRKYIIVWGVLLAALGFSLLAGVLGHGALMVALVFGAAFAKAVLVVMQFMHMSLEPRWIKWILIGAAAVVLVFYFGVTPDVVWVFGRKGAP